MTNETDRQPASDDFVDQQTAAAGGVEAVEAYENAAGEARGEDVRAAQDEDDDIEGDVEDADEDDLDEDDLDEDNLDEDDDEDEDDVDLDEDEDGEDLRIDDDGNPVAR